ncbi:lymphocyte antigen 6B-like isoform X2 [Hemicordylus capensis]|uniref:lymphocyte antigen 6B-like isoform X2 n=1 Tax=Hemicordylus capensis TaxID=884348 RepID=UPI002302D310|nr:lymphocyte antigen 6B-like isoform X2 [Hemicordylus capensis]
MVPVIQTHLDKDLFLVGLVLVKSNKMNKILLLGVSALLCWSTVQGLRCRQCMRYVMDHCVVEESTCQVSPSRNVCMTLVTSLEKKSMRYSCMHAAICRTFEEKSRTKPDMYAECCKTDLCNGIPPWASDLSISTTLNSTNLLE